MDKVSFKRRLIANTRGMMNKTSAVCIPTNRRDCVESMLYTTRRFTEKAGALSTATFWLCSIEQDIHYTFLLPFRPRYINIIALESHSLRSAHIGTIVL